MLTSGTKKKKLRCQTGQGLIFQVVIAHSVAIKTKILNDHEACF